MHRSFLLLFFVVPSLVVGQLAVEPRTSPLAIASVRNKDAYLKIVYSQPHKKGREVFGKLVPYGQVWRTGANEATEITVTRDVIVSNQKLKAGTYSLFTIPNTTSWTIIVNSELGLWGSYNYNSKLDVMRFDVPSEQIVGATYEPFTVAIDSKPDNAFVSMMWDKTKVTFLIQFTETK